MLASPSHGNPNQKPLNLNGFEESYVTTCKLLLSLTQSRSLSKGLQLHTFIIKSGIQSIPIISHHLINFYSKTQNPIESGRIFDEAPLKSATTWSSVISSFTQNELPWHGIEYFRQMLATGIPPDDHTFPSATKSCAILSRADIGKSFHCLALKTRYDRDVFVGSSIVDMYAKCGEIENARKMFDNMPERNVVSWSGMIYGYTQLGQNEEALNLFKQALMEKLEVNDFTFSSVIRVCGNSTLLELGKQIHGLCLKTSYVSSTFVGSALVSLYSKSGIIEEAYQVFYEMPTRNLGLWNSILIASAQHSHTQKAFHFFNQMEFQPNFITYLIILYACSHSGLVEEGKHYFHLMKKQGIQPTDQHYASMVDLLSRAGRLNEAVSIIEEMPMKPTESIWGALLTGCRIHGNTELASFAADKAFEIGFISPGMNILLSNAYMSAGRYEEAANARKMLRDRRVKKETGLSWIEEGNKVHTFASGDRSHLKSREIYLKLGEIELKMEKFGYFISNELESRDVRYHSERLAIAFGLIAIAGERPIRVMKNLRVCGDCHNTIKFMGKCTGRVIIVRDNNRFHRFENGKCSCNDYW